MRALLVLATALLLPACTTAPVRAPDAALFDDALFAPPTERIDADEVFAISPQMQAFIDSDIAAEQRRKGPQVGLFDALFKRGEPWLEYDATVTHTAAEAFSTRSGNCLSMVLMTGAFARQLGLPVRYQSVDTWRTWSRDDKLMYLHTHVNVVLLAPGGAGRQELVIDFEPVEADQLRHTQVVQEATIVAMYMNNRAVALLAQRDTDRAYWWARAAIGHDAGYLDAVNTLAVIYNAHGRPAESERALRWLLENEPDNIVALDNLERALRGQGRTSEAAAVAKQVAQLRPIPPFHYYDLGETALKQGRYRVAKELFLKELRRDARYDKLHASLALAHYGLGEHDQAVAHLAIARDNSTSTGDRELYARMLDRLRQGQHPVPAPSEPGVDRAR